MLKKVLDFRSYHKINEENQDPSSGVISTVDQIVNLFFQGYSAIVTKIDKYTSAVQDLKDLSNSKNPGEDMVKTMEKVSNEVGYIYGKPSDEIVLATKKLKEAYDLLIKSDEAKDSVDKIGSTIKDKIIDYLASLKTAVDEAPKAITKTSDDTSEGNKYNYNEQGHLFEKNIFSNERQEIIRKITPVYAQIVDLSENSPSDLLKQECIAISKQLQSYLEKLSDKNDQEWEGMKKKQRKDEIEVILNYINDIPSKMNEIQSKTLIKMGMDQKVQNAINSAMELINGAMEQFNTIEAGDKRYAGTDDGENTDKPNDSKIEYVEIKTGNVDKQNLTKAGEHFDEIMKIQNKLNTFLPDEEKIKTDGGYGEKTEEAIKKVASMFSGLVPELKNIDGKTITKDLQVFLDKYEKNKDQIAGLFK